MSNKVKDLKINAEEDEEDELLNNQQLQQQLLGSAVAGVEMEEKVEGLILIDPLLQQHHHQQVIDQDQQQEYEVNGNSLERSNSKKPRKSSAHPSPPWKELNWMYTRKMLNILLDPQNDQMRRSLWPRVGELSVGGSRIEYQTKLALATLNDWSNREDVLSDPKWYGNRVKDWMHKLPKIYVDSENELRNAAVASGGVNTEESTSAAITRCPVFKELQELLGGTEASNITAERVASQIGAAGTGSHGILDPSLNVAVAVGSHYSPGITVPRAQVLERRYPQMTPTTPQYHYQIQRSSSAIQGSSKSLGKRVRLDSEPLSSDSQDESLPSLPGQNLLAEEVDQIYVNSTSTSHSNSNGISGHHTDESSNSRKIRKMDQYHERAKKRDEMEHARMLLQMQTIENDKARAEAEKIRLHRIEEMKLEQAIMQSRIQASELEQRPVASGKKNGN